MRYRIISLASLVALALACHNPAGTTVQTPTKVAPTAIKLDGPTRFAPTSTPKFTVTATMSDGSKQDYTNQTVYYASSLFGGPVPLSIGPNAVLVVRSTGEATLNASYAGLRPSSLNVMVIPDGTYRLVGTVQEGGLPVSGATVTVIAGTGTGLSAMSDFNGNYRLYGVAGPVQLQVTKPGYDAATNSATISTDDVLNFPNMAETGGPPGIAGTYSLSIIAAGDCRVSNGVAPLATPNRNRTYTATVTENGPTVQVTLSGANFLVQNGVGNQFSGRVSPGHVSFTLQDTGGYAYYYYYSVGQPQVRELLPGNSILSFWGIADATLSQAGITGVFYGNIVVYDATSLKMMESCLSGKHQFTMTPLTSTRRKR